MNKRASTAYVQPTFQAEASLWAQSYRAVAGVDEAGRGALAGPVVAAAVIAPINSHLAGVWAEVRDSKKLRPPERARLAANIRAEAAAWAVGVVECTRIDTEGIAAATRSAMMAAISALSTPADALIIDWVRLPHLNLRQLSMSKADAHVVSVAAASILAKEHRDQLLRELDARYPEYGFGAHKGYGTAAHLQALTRHGPCPEHRRTFAPLAVDARLLEA